ncbi:MAG: smc [Acidimicrobiia bacterium]|nr:smc [Acidimicrobiia bacterium]
MFLKSLTMKGFKSFADTTTLDLEPGVTVVVGPNGSGKSNVVDAIAWVLGAQAPSAVRSQKMDDVIFAGTSKRPALGRAEVSITVDNAAGLLPIDFSEVTLSRTLFRTGESEYAINGVSCRLLDIQELLSDSGVGRQQHVIVSQGQIDAVLNARTEDRRAIVEEAAGVLKYRKRKERSERRLESTEANLLRIQDMLREVRRQLRPLEKQAEAAQRHAAVAGELQALKLHLAGRELEGLQQRLAATARLRAEQRAQDTEVKGRLTQLDADIMATEARLVAEGGNDVGDVLRRAESLRERARGLSAVLTERRRSIERDRGALLDTSLLASLEADAARFASELADVEHAALELGPAADEVVEAEAALERERSELAAVERTSEPGVSSARAAAEVRGELGALSTAVSRAQGEVHRTEARASNLQQRLDRLGDEIERLTASASEATVAEAGLAVEVQNVAIERVEADRRYESIEAERRSLEASAATWTARADALNSALDAARARAGAQRLADLPGMVGTLLDLVRVDEGWEAAFEAAAAEALAAVVMDSPEAGRRALDVLAAAGHSGAVVVLGSSAPANGLATGGLRARVSGLRPGVDGLLDQLLGSVRVVDGGWEQAVDAALADPTAVVVTKAGDRFGAASWRLGTQGGGATAAAAQEAAERAEAARAELAAANEEFQRAKAALAEIRRREQDTVARRAAADKRISASTDGAQRAVRERDNLTSELASVHTQLTELRERVERDRVRLSELQAVLPDLEAAESAEAEQQLAARSVRARLAERATAVSALRRDLEVRAAGLEERRTFLQGRLTEVERRLEADASERQEAESRRARLDTALLAVDRLSALVAAHSVTLEAHLSELYEQRRHQSDAVRVITEGLEQLRRDRLAAEKLLEGLREQVRRAELDEAELTLRLEGIAETIRRDLECEPEATLTAECPLLAEGATAAGRARELERELKLMGPINPLALEEFSALSERHTFLETQLEDVRSTRRELSKVISAVDQEIQSVFAAAFADVSANFEKLFAMLFPGGNGRLVLTDPDNLLATGI